MFNLALILDSTTNFAVYAIMNRRFRVTLCALLHCQCDSHAGERNQRARLSSAAVTASGATRSSRLLAAASGAASSPSMPARSPNVYTFHSHAGHPHGAPHPAGHYARASGGGGAGASQSGPKNSAGAASALRSQSIPNESSNSAHRTAAASCGERRRGSADTANGGRCSLIGGLETIEEVRSVELDSCACSISHAADSHSPIECELVSY